MSFNLRSWLGFPDEAEMRSKRHEPSFFDHGGDDPPQAIGRTSGRSGNGLFAQNFPPAPPIWGRTSRGWGQTLMHKNAALQEFAAQKEDSI